MTRRVLLSTGVLLILGAIAFGQVQRRQAYQTRQADFNQVYDAANKALENKEFAKAYELYQKARDVVFENKPKDLEEKLARAQAEYAYATAIAKLKTLVEKQSWPEARKMYWTAWKAKGETPELLEYRKSSKLDVVETSSDGRYQKYSSGVILDRNTNLEWYVGPDQDTTWYEAKAWVDGLTVDGGGWRLPKVEELNGLYQKGKGSRNMDTIFNISGWRIWNCECNGSYAVSFFSTAAVRTGAAVATPPTAACLVCAGEDVDDV
jgi:hypothetical protein